MKKVRLIIAGNHLEFDRYRKAKNFKTVECIYLTNIDQLCGYENCILDLVGTYWNNSLFKKAIPTCAYCLAHNIKTPVRLCRQRP